MPRIPTVRTIRPVSFDPRVDLSVLLKRQQRTPVTDQEFWEGVDTAHAYLLDLGDERIDVVALWDDLTQTEVRLIATVQEVTRGPGDQVHREFLRSQGLSDDDIDQIPDPGVAVSPWKLVTVYFGPAHLEGGHVAPGSFDMWMCSKILFGGPVSRRGADLLLSCLAPYDVLAREPAGERA